jgi:hypothetical protein
MQISGTITVLVDEVAVEQQMIKDGEKYPSISIAQRAANAREDVISFRRACERQGFTISLSVTSSKPDRSFQIMYTIRPMTERERQEAA